MRWSVLTVGLILVGLFWWGVQNAYFHQDDLDWFLLANRPLGEVLVYPIGDHVNYLFRLLINIEWNWFGFNFAPYLLVSVVMHGIVIWLIYLVARASSGRRDLAAIAAVLFSINTNWNETVLWISGQTISITAIFVLLAMLAIWNNKSQGLMLFLASWTSALSLGLLGATVVVDKRLRWKAIVILMLVGLIYLFWGGDGTSLPSSVTWLSRVVVVAGLMVVNTVIGRLIIPFDQFELMRIGIVTALLLWGLWRWRSQLIAVWRDQWSRLLVVQIFFYNMVVAVGRAQFGIGIMRAERYSYIGLALLLLLAVRIFRKVKFGKWIWVVPVIVILQIIGFDVRARAYIVRPQQLKILVRQLRQMRDEEIVMDAYLPKFVLNDDRLKYRDLLSLIKD